MTTEQQAHNDRMVARCAEPDGTIETHGGRDWARIHPMRCPICGAIFYGWMPLDAEWEPFATAPSTDGKKAGDRETCGHPSCHEAEQENNFRRRTGRAAFERP